MAKTKTIDLVEINANSIFTPVDVMGNFNKLKVGINDVNTKVDNIELTDTKIDVVADNKKLNVVLQEIKTKNNSQDTEINRRAIKGEIKPTDIKGNTYKKLYTNISFSNIQTNDPLLSLNFVDENGTGYSTNLHFNSLKYFKDMDSAIEQLKTDVGGYANRLATANDKISNNI